MNQLAENLQVPVAIVGASGYSGQELLRVLTRHPNVTVTCVTSRQFAGKSIGEVYPRFAGTALGPLLFSAAEAAQIVASGAEVAFLALPHGLAHEFAEPLLQAGVKVIDLSADFRVKDAAVFADFYGTPHPAPALLAQSVYGLPEVYGAAIAQARLIASPGCYPTSILLPLIPLLRARLLDPATIIVNSLSGVSGAGRKAELDYLYCECNENARAYGVPKHRHLSEIEQELSFAAGRPVVISFNPHLIPLSRGIATTIVAQLAPEVPGADEAAVRAALSQAYETAPFVRLKGARGSAEIKHVAGTNYADIAWRLDARTSRVVLMSAIDNLLKGAAGQAVQSLNLLHGWVPTLGLL